MRYASNRVMPSVGFSIRPILTSQQILQLEQIFFRHYSFHLPEHLHLKKIQTTFAYNNVTIPFLGFIWLYLHKAPEKNICMPVGNIGATHQNLTFFNDKFWSDIFAMGKARIISSTEKKKKIQQVYCQLYDRDVFYCRAQKEVSQRKQRIWQLRAKKIEQRLSPWQYGAVFWGITGVNDILFRDVSVFL